MFAVMTWNLENLQRPAATAEQAVKDRYASKLKQITELITTAAPDLLGVQEVLAQPHDRAPGVFNDLRDGLGAGWNGCLSQRPDERGIRVGWLSKEQLTNPTDVAAYPQGFRGDVFTRVQEAAPSLRVSVMLFRPVCYLSARAATLKP
jgi:endonuclease/exonuclease/phosphatase family metal-dependent hydrolase